MYERFTYFLVVRNPLSALSQVSRGQGVTGLWQYTPATETLLPEHFRTGMSRRALALAVTF